MWLLLCVYSWDVAGEGCLPASGTEQTWYLTEVPCEWSVAVTDAYGSCSGS